MIHGRTSDCFLGMDALDKLETDDGLRSNFLLYVQYNINDRLSFNSHSFLYLNAKLINFFGMTFSNIQETLKIALDDNEVQHFIKKCDKTS